MAQTVRDPVTGRFRPTPAVDRFWAQVDRSDPNGCWPWLGTTFPKTRYGSFALSHRKTVSAHRFAYELAHGPIPDGMDVLHHCDNPPCARDAHLFLGTDLDNAADRDAKGRGASGLRSGAYTHPERVRRGNNHGQSKLRDEDIPGIRAAYEAGTSQYQLARDHNVSQSTICAAIHGRYRKHLDQQPGGNIQ